MPSSSLCVSPPILRLDALCTLRCFLIEFCSFPSAPHPFSVHVFHLYCLCYSLTNAVCDVVIIVFGFVALSAANLTQPVQKLIFLARVFFFLPWQTCHYFARVFWVSGEHSQHQSPTPASHLLDPGKCSNLSDRAVAAACLDWAGDLFSTVVSDKKF